MPDFNVNRVIIHELVKEQHESILDNKYGENVLDTSSEIVRRLVESIIKIYGKKDNSAQYGIFDTGAGRGSFPDQFLNYYRTESPSDDDFKKIAKEAMISLYGKAQGRQAASGGYILFADYVSDHGRFLCSLL